VSVTTNENKTLFKLISSKKSKSIRSINVKFTVSNDMNDGVVENSAVDSYDIHGKQQLIPHLEFNSLQRIERILANRGIGSRKDVLQLIKSKKVETFDRKKKICSGAERYPSNADVYVNGILSSQVSNITFSATYSSSFT
jgi:predicted transcriptional regulator